MYVTTVFKTIETHAPNDIFYSYFQLTSLHLSYSLLVLSVVHFFTGTYLFISTIQAWNCPPEREAIIKILEEKITTNKVASGNPAPRDT